MGPKREREKLTLSRAAARRSELAAGNSFFPWAGLGFLGGSGRMRCAPRVSVWGTPVLGVYTTLHYYRRLLDR